MKVCGNPESLDSERFGLREEITDDTVCLARSLRTPRTLTTVHSKSLEPGRHNQLTSSDTSSGFPYQEDQLTRQRLIVKTGFRACTATKQTPSKSRQSRIQGLNMENIDPTYVIRHPSPSKELQLPEERFVRQALVPVPQNAGLSEVVQLLKHARRVFRSQLQTEQLGDCSQAYFQ